MCGCTARCVLWQRRVVGFHSRAAPRGESANSGWKVRGKSGDGSGGTRLRVSDRKLNTVSQKRIRTPNPSDIKECLILVPGLVALLETKSHS